MTDQAEELAKAIETTMQVIIALRWAAQRRDGLPAALDNASQDLLDELYALQRRCRAAAPPTTDNCGPDAVDAGAGAPRACVDSHAYV